MRKEEEEEKEITRDIEKNIGWSWKIRKEKRRNYQDTQKKKEK